MKNIIQVISVFFLLSIPFSIQATPNSLSAKKLKPFDEIKVFGLMQVKLIQGKSEKISIKGADADNVKIKQRGKTLKIQLLKSVGRDVDARITITYRQLDKITASAGARVNARNIIKANRLVIKAKSGSQVNFDLEVKTLDVSVGEGSKATLAGQAITQNVKISTGGILEAYDLSSVESYVNINAGGRAEIYVEETLEATVNMGGKILYAGQPRDVKENILISGTVAKAN